jgi:hypothetical protein
MNTIQFPIHYEGSLGEKTLITSFDKSVLYSCVDADLLKNLCTKNRLPHIKTFYFNGLPYEVYHVTILDFYINNLQLSDEIMVVPNLSEQVIIGELTIRKWRMQLDFENNSIFIDPKVARFRI